MASKLKQAVLPLKGRNSTTIGIIGSAGRRGDARKMSKDIFYKMLNKTEEIITHKFGLALSQVHLISGGAAWADHIAVMQFINCKIHALTLHLPTRWHQDEDNPHYDDNGNTNIWKNPGRSANKLHKQFTDKLGESSLKHVSSAIYTGAIHHVHDGFMKRNTAIARDSKYLIAFTWNEGESPKTESGTHDTWNKHSGIKIHIPIGSLMNPTKFHYSSSMESTTSESSVSPESEIEPNSLDSAYCSESQSDEVSQDEQLQGHVHGVTDLSNFSCDGQSETTKDSVKSKRKRTLCDLDTKFNSTDTKKIKYNS